jgi:hypothetical protein
MVIAQSVWLYQLVDIFIGYCKGFYHISITQLVCCIGYLISLSTSLIAIIITIYKELHSHIHYTSIWLSKLSIQLLWTCSITLFVIMFIIILRDHCVKLSITRGYNSPLPLDKTKRGWEPVVNKIEDSFVLLGTYKSSRLSQVTLHMEYSNHEAVKNYQLEQPYLSATNDLYDDKISPL